jgi:hypothetical protein
MTEFLLAIKELINLASQAGGQRKKGSEDNTD